MANGRPLTLFLRLLTLICSGSQAGSFGFFAASDSGLYHKTAIDSPWVRVPIDSSDGIKYLAHSGDRLMFTSEPRVPSGGKSYGIFSSQDGGKTWSRTENIIERDPYGLMAADSGIILYTYEGVYTSQGGKTDWKSTLRIPGMSSILISIARAGNSLVAGGNGPWWTSFDEGRTWSDLPQRIPGPTPKAILVDAGLVWAGTESGYAVWDGTSKLWQNRPLAGGAVIALAKHGGRIFAGTDSGAYFSDDTGLSWSKILSLPGRDARGFEFAGDTAYAISNGDCFMSEDHGANWKSIGMGLPGKVTGLAASDTVPGASNTPLDTGAGKPAIGDFAPLGLGFTWKYLRRDSARIVSDYMKETSIRTLVVDSEFQEGAGKRFHVQMRDSLLSSSGGSTQLRNFGRSRETGITVHESAEGTLRIVLDDTAYFKTFEYMTAPSAFFQSAFRQHRFGKYHLSDVTQDKSRPQYISQWITDNRVYYDIVLEKDIGLSVYNSQYFGVGDRTREIIQYELLSYHGIKNVTGLAAKKARAKVTRSQIIFNGRSLLIDSRRLDGRAQ